jgi:hypothetical protein
MTRSGGHGFVQAGREQERADDPTPGREAPEQNTTRDRDDGTHASVLTYGVQKSSLLID